MADTTSHHQKKSYLGSKRAVRTLLGAMVLGAIGGVLVPALLYQPFYIPTRSMLPTLLPGDHVVVDKTAYGYSGQSSSLLRWLGEKRIFSRAPQRGDIIAFNKHYGGQTETAKTTLIKRAIAAPNDSVRLHKGTVYVNGNPLPQSESRPYTFFRHGIELPEQGRVSSEMMPNGERHQILDIDDITGVTDMQEIIIPEGKYFVLGDNRDESVDSRSVALVGLVDESEIIGRVEGIWLSYPPNSKLWHIGSWKADRLGAVN